MNATTPPYRTTQTHDLETDQGSPVKVEVRSPVQALGDAAVGPTGFDVYVKDPDKDGYSVVTTGTDIMDDDTYKQYVDVLAFLQRVALDTYERVEQDGKTVLTVKSL